MAPLSLATHRLSLVVVNRGYSSLWCSAFHWSCFSCFRTQSLEHTLGSCSSWALEHGLNSCGSWAQLLQGMWDLSGPGMESVFPASSGRFPSTAPAGKSLSVFYYHIVHACWVASVLSDCLQTHGQKFLLNLRLTYPLPTRIPWISTGTWATSGILSLLLKLFSGFPSPAKDSWSSHA